VHISESVLTLSRVDSSDQQGADSGSVVAAGSLHHPIISMWTTVLSRMASHMLWVVSQEHHSCRLLSPQPINSHPTCSLLQQSAGQGTQALPTACEHII